MPSSGVSNAHLCAATVAAIAVVTGIIAAAIIGDADPLRANVAVALAPIAPKTLEGLDMLIVDGPPIGAAEGLRLALLGVLVGGMPAAFVAMGLTARTGRVGGHWRAGWGPVFQAGFVFQFSSLVVTTCVLSVIVVATVADFRQMFSLFGFTVAMLFASVLSGAFGIRSWRRLQTTVDRTVSRITS